MENPKKPVFAIVLNETNEIRFYLEDFQGKKYGNVRQYWKPNGKNEFVPTKKGWTLSRSEFAKLLQGVCELAKALGLDITGA